MKHDEPFRKICAISRAYCECPRTAVLLRPTDMPDDLILQAKAREAIQNGKLPMRSPDSTMGGPGCGEACAICGETLRRTQMELEAEFRQDGEIPELHKYHLHPRCFAAWEFERSKGGDASPVVQVQD